MPSKLKVKTSEITLFDEGKTTADIANLRRVVLVVANGRVLDPAARRRSEGFRGLQ
jgi:hypothetical protein